MERRKRSRAPDPPTPEEIATAVKNFEGKGKKWALPVETWMVLEEVYPFPVRKNMTVTHAVLNKYPKWWLLDLGGCPLPAFETLYEVVAWFTGSGISVEFKVAAPFSFLTEEESDAMVNILSRYHEVEYEKRKRKAPTPDPDKVKEINKGRLN